jgi:hypothetical protein
MALPLVLEGFPVSTTAQQVSSFLTKTLSCPSGALTLPPINRNEFNDVKVIVHKKDLYQTLLEKRQILYDEHVITVQEAPRYRVVLAPVPPNVSEDQMKRLPWATDVVSVEYDPEFVCFATVCLRSEDAKQQLLRAGMLAGYCFIMSR